MPARGKSRRIRNRRTSSGTCTGIIYTQGTNQRIQWVGFHLDMALPTRSEVLSITSSSFIHENFIIEIPHLVSPIY
jgi:hypothetical protein